MNRAARNFTSDLNEASTVAQKVGLIGSLIWETKCYEERRPSYQEGSDEVDLWISLIMAGPQSEDCANLFQGTSIAPAWQRTLLMP